MTIAHCGRCLQSHDTAECRNQRTDSGHGSPADRGSADRYYGRSAEPHFYRGATYDGQRVDVMPGTPEHAAYMQAWHAETDRKDWG